MAEQSKPQGDAADSGKVSDESARKTEPEQQSAAAKPAEKVADTKSPQQTPARTAAPKPKPTTAQAGGGSRASMALTVVALVIALAALAGAGWLYQQNMELTTRLSDVDRDARARFDALASHDAIKGLDERTRLLAERVAARFAKIDESLQSTNEALRSASEEQIRDQRGWRLAEIDYVLRIAAHRLMLLQDIDGAIAALQTADRQLHQLGSPVFIPLREQLNDDIRALRAVQRPDIPGVAIRLDGLIDAAYELPPRSVPTGFQTTSSDAAGALTGVWEKLQRFVVIKRNEEPLRAPPIRYAPENHARTLAATLGAAQTAALRTDTAEYRRLLASAGQSLRDNFDPASQLVTDTLREVEALSGVAITAELPDITGAFALLDELRSGGGEAEETAQ